MVEEDIYGKWRGGKRSTSLSLGFLEGIIKIFIFLDCRIH